jgi:hypothetical protein
VLPGSSDVGELAISDKRLQRLFDEERVALGQRIQLVQYLRRGRAVRSEDRLQHESELGQTKRRHAQLGCQALAVEGG